MFWSKRHIERKLKPVGQKKNLHSNRVTNPPHLDKEYRTDRTPAPPFDTGFVYYEEK